MAPTELHVTTCPAELRPAAIRWLHRRLPADQRDWLVASLSAVDASDADAWEGLLIATEESIDTNCPAAAADALPLASAAWLQPGAGNMAVVWLADPADEAAGPLLAALAELVDRRGVALAQLLMPGELAHQGNLRERLARFGFPQLAELIYLYVELPASATPASAAPGLQFMPHAGDESARLAAVIRATYAETRDCPGLDGVRNLDDVLSGYRTQGRFMPEHWYLVRGEDRDVGALILSAYPDAGNWELVYMGVVPSARGRGWGMQIVEHAKACATRGGAERLVLAVDAANEPARAVYRDAGFSEWDRRLVFARLRNADRMSSSAG